MMKLWGILLLCLPLGAQTITLNHASSYPSIGSGIGMYGPNYFNSLYFKNLLTVNPSLQPTQQNIIDTANSGTTTTYTSLNGFQTATVNQFVGWTVTIACHFNGTTGCGGGANNCVSTVTANTVGYSGGAQSPITYTFSPACAGAVAQYDATRVAFNGASATVPTNGIQYGGTNMGTFSVDTTGANLPAAVSPLPQVLQVTKLTNPASGNSFVETGLDSTSGSLNYAFSGTYNGSIQVNVLSGSGCSVNLTVQRGSNTPIINQTDSLSGTGWQTYSFTGTGAETSATTQALVYARYTFTGQCTLDFYAMRLVEASSTNASPFRDYVVLTQIKNGLNAGSMRYNPLNVGNGGTLGCSFDDTLQPDIARAPCNSSVNNGYAANQLPMGFNDFLQGCLVAGVKVCHIDVSPTLTATEAHHMADFLGDTTGTSYGTLRATLNGGNTATWWSQFSKIIIGYGNEVWNGGNGDYIDNNIYRSAAMTSQFCQALKSMASWNSAVGQCAVSVMQNSGINNANRVASVDTGAALNAGPFIDALSSSDYYLVGTFGGSNSRYDINPCSMPNLFNDGVNEAYANTQSGSGLSTASNLSQAAASTYKLVGYETGSNYGGGNCTAAQIVGTYEGLGEGLVDALTWDETMAAYPGTQLEWNFWELNGLNRTFPAPSILGYSSSLAYYVGNVVQSGGVNYSAVSPSTGQSVTNTTYFVPYTYSSGTTYPAGAVLYNGSGAYYQSLVGSNTGNALTNTSFWTPMATTQRGWGAYNGVGGAFTAPVSSVSAQYAANTCSNLGTGYATTSTGVPTLSTAAENGIPALTNVPQIRVFDNSNGTTECIKIYNKQSTSATVTLAGTYAPAHTVLKTVYTSANLTDAGVTNTTSSAAATSSYTVPAYSLTTLAFPLSGVTITVTPTTATTGTVGTAYSQTFTASGGTSPYTFSTTATTGSFPPGLTLSTAGVLSGTPTTASTYTFTISGTDSASNNFTSSTITLTVMAGTIYGLF